MQTIFNKPLSYEDEVDKPALELSNTEPKVNNPLIDLLVKEGKYKDIRQIPQPF